MATQLNSFNGYGGSVTVNEAEAVVLVKKFWAMCPNAKVISTDEVFQKALGLPKVKPSKAYGMAFESKVEAMKPHKVFQVYRSGTEFKVCFYWYGEEELLPMDPSKGEERLAKVKFY